MPNMLSVEEAIARIAALIEPVTGFEQLPLHATLGRILATDITSPIDVPAYVNSAMDGYAVRATDLVDDGEHELTVIGTALAGQPFAGEVAPGEAVRIMTGAKLPGGADSVVMQENARREGDQVFIPGKQRLGQNVRQAGEDMARGDVVLSHGKRIDPAEVGLLASLGIPEVRVVRRPRVAFFSTGDELRSLGEPLGEGELYDSNRYTLHGMLTRLGAEPIDMGVVRDRPDEIRAAFEQAAATADVLITSGGVSVGEADYVKQTLDALGQVDFWKVAMKPGKPLAFGQLGKCLFFGLPGNPVSAMATFYQIVQPGLRRLTGETGNAPLRITVPCASELKKRPGRVDFQRGILEQGPNGPVVRSSGHQGSHVLSSMSRANCFIVLPAAWGNVEVGTPVEVMPFAGLV